MSWHIVLTVKKTIIAIRLTQRFFASEKIEKDRCLKPASINNLIQTVTKQIRSSFLLLELFLLVFS